HATRHGARRAAIGWLGASAALGAGFLALKAWEYARHLGEGIRPGAYYDFKALPDPAANAFFTLYYLMTGLHGLHVVGGVLALAGCALLGLRRRVGRDRPTRVELSGLYWHLVDAIWLFLWPIFYLMR